MERDFVRTVVSAGWFEERESVNMAAGLGLGNRKEVERFLGRRAVKQANDGSRTVFGKSGVLTASSAN